MPPCSVVTTAPEELDALLADIRRCEACASKLPLGPRPVLRVRRGARILVAGQAPGIRVHESGIPFNDPSGDRLRNWMRVDRDTFYDSRRIAIVPMGFCYPGSAQRGDLPPLAECARRWHPHLIPLLENIELVLALGTHAQRYYLGHGRHCGSPEFRNQRPLGRMGTLTETVRNWRCYGPGIIPLPHPSPRNNIWIRRNPWFEKELLPELAKRVAALI